jgi:hypothetical protein
MIARHDLIQRYSGALLAVGATSMVLSIGDLEGVRQRDDRVESFGRGDRIGQIGATDPPAAILPLKRVTSRSQASQRRPPADDPVGRILDWYRHARVVEHVAVGQRLVAARAVLDRDCTTAVVADPDQLVIRATWTGAALEQLAAEMSENLHRSPPFAGAPVPSASGAGCAALHKPAGQ